MRAGIRPLAAGHVLMCHGVSLQLVSWPRARNLRGSAAAPPYSGQRHRIGNSTIDSGYIYGEQSSDSTLPDEIQWIKLTVPDDTGWRRVLSATTLPNQKKHVHGGSCSNLAQQRSKLVSYDISCKRFGSSTLFL
jgi:hypothetical protein